MKEPNKPSDNKPPFGNNPLRIAMDAGDAAVLTDNEAIIRLIMKEDPEKGFAALFRRYYSPLCSHAARFVYSREIAEDIVSEVFLNFWKKKLYETVTASFRAYLYAAVRNSAFNQLKQEFGERLAPESDQSWVEDANPQSILLLTELMTKIERTIDSFPPQCQKVFLLSRFEGRKNREIADQLQIKCKTVEAHMMKALGILKKTVSDYLK